MVQDTDKIIEQVIQQNPGIPANQEIYAYCNNKIPVHKGLKDLNHQPKKDYNSIAIRINKSNYICIDFDGTSTSTDKEIQKQEKQSTAETIKNYFLELLDEQTKKYRVDKTASNKYHI